MVLLLPPCCWILDPSRSMFVAGVAGAGAGAAHTHTAASAAGADVAVDVADGGVGIRPVDPPTGDWVGSSSHCYSTFATIFLEIKRQPSCFVRAGATSFCTNRTLA